MSRSSDICHKRLGSVGIATLLAFVVLLGCASSGGPDPERLRSYGQTLLNAGLYSQAAQVFDQYISILDVPETKKANIQLLLARTFLDQAHDYEAALARFLWIEQFAKKFGRMAEVRRGKITALERMGRSTDAQLALERAASPGVEGSDDPTGAIVLARLGDRTITEYDLRRILDVMPPDMRKSYDPAEKKAEMVRQLVARELLSDAAKRRGFDREPVIARQIAEFEKDIYSRRVIEEELSKLVQVTDLDVKNFYEANKDRYTDEGQNSPKPLSEVDQTVRRDVEIAKRQEAADAFINQLLKTEDVTLYLDRLE